MPIIAIDPDVHKSGLAFFSAGSLVLHSLTFLELQAILKILQADEVRVEAGWLNETANFHAAKNKKVAARIGSHVGANAQVGKLIVETCKDLKLKVRLVKPFKKTWGKNNRSKISHPELTALLNKKNIQCAVQTTNQEERDAALIAIASF